MEPKHHAAGVRTYYSGVRGLDPQGFIELIFLKDLVPGYLWVFPLPGGRANVGLGLRSDVVRKTLAGVAPTTRLPSEAYTAARSAEVFAAIARHAKVLLAAGRTVIADGVFGAAAQRQEIAAAARAARARARRSWPRALLRRTGSGSRSDERADRSARKGAGPCGRA